MEQNEIDRWGRLIATTAVQSERGITQDQRAAAASPSVASAETPKGAAEQTAAHPTPSDFWAKDIPSTEDEALSLLRFGAVLNDIRTNGEFVDQVRTERRMLNCADFFERENAELRAQLAEVKEALAGDDYASLPSDYPLVRMAHTIRADHDKFRNQVIDTCKRAETAERQRDEALAQRGTLSYSTEGGWTPLGEQIVRLEKERDEARKDAERYRWIRQEAAKSIEDEDLSDELWAVWEFLLQGNNDPDEMDAAIDAALAAKEKTNG